jgi:VWFA-related protein
MTAPKPSLVSLALLCSAGALAQAPVPVPDPQAPPSFPAQAEMVVVDVVVTGEGGGPVPGLRAEDFSVSEDGTPQQVVSFEEIDVAGTPGVELSWQPKRRVAVNTGLPAMSSRSFVLVLDEVHMTAVGAHRAKAAATEFLRFGPREGDAVMLLSTAGGSWWMTRSEEGKQELSAVLKRLRGPYLVNDMPDRITDWEAMRIWQDRDPITLEQVRRRFETYVTGKQREAEGVPVRGIDRLTEGEKMWVTDDEILGRAQDAYQQAVVRNRTTLSGLVRVLDGLGGVRGRKTVILFSEGFIRDPRVEETAAVIRAAQRTNTAVYFVDVRGLAAMPLAATAQFGPMLPAEDVSTQITQELVSAEGADTIAVNTGGFQIKNTNDLERGLRRIAQEARRYYLLGYSPTNTHADGRWRKIAVRVAGSGRNVRARQGYFAPGSGKKGARGPGAWKPGMQQAIDSPYEFDGIPLRMTHHVFGEAAPRKARVLLTAEVDVRRLAFEESDGRSLDTLEFLLVVTHRESGEYQRRDKSLELKLSADVRASMERSWLRKNDELELVPGGHLAKLVVRDKRSGTIGSIAHEFEVDDPRQWHASTPILSDALEPRGEGEPLRPVIPARRSFQTGATLYYQFEVYGSVPDPASGMPRVSAGFLVRSGDGAVVTRGQPALIRPAGEGRIARIGVVPLEGMAAGRYELVLDVEDQVAGRRMVVTEPFEVVATPAG